MRDWGRDDDEHWRRHWSLYGRERGWPERWHGRSIAERSMGDRGAYERDPYQGYEPERWGGTYAPDRYRMEYPRLGPRGRAPRGYVRSDERIKEDLCDRLMHSWIDAEDVDIQVRGGEVFLAGTVEDRASKRAIEDLADDVLGVKDVQNNIRLRARGEPGERAPSTNKPKA
jgi:hypothetical protein